MELDAAEQSTVTAIARALGTGIHLVESSVGRALEPGRTIDL
jgi:hypothetical protein